MKTVANKTGVGIDIIYITKVQTMNHYRSARKGGKRVRRMAIWEVKLFS